MAVSKIYSDLENVIDRYGRAVLRVTGRCDDVIVQHARMEKARKQLTTADAAKKAAWNKRAAQWRVAKDQALAKVKGFSFPQYKRIGQTLRQLSQAENEELSWKFTKFNYRLISYIKWLRSCTLEDL